MNNVDAKLGDIIEQTFLIFSQTLQKSNSKDCAELIQSHQVVQVILARLVMCDSTQVDAKGNQRFDQVFDVKPKSDS